MTSIMAGLNEAIEDSKNPTLPRTTVTIEPVKNYKPEEIKTIRNSVGMTQKLFASFMGVSFKTIEAWESGTNNPNGSAKRLLSMMEMNANLTKEYPFVRL